MGLTDNGAGLRSAACRVKLASRLESSRQHYGVRQFMSNPATGMSTPIPDKSSLHRSPDTANINVEPDLSTHMRHLMRRIPHSAVVITASAEATSPDSIPEASFRGMTISSFNTVSLSPTPLVSFNVKMPSATYSALRSSGTFLVHMLHATTAGAQICDVFAKGNGSTGDAFRHLVSSSKGESSAVKVFSGTGTNGAPLVAAPGVLRVLKCKVLPGKEVQVGEHVVVIGEVLSILSTPGSSPASWKENQASEGRMGLIYADRQYHKLGEELTLLEEPGLRTTFSELPNDVRQTMGLNIRRGDER